jgi:hypothetical protein
LWDTINYGGYIETPSGKRFRLKDIDNPNPQKVLNYYIQNFETSQNVMQFHALFNDFRPLKSRIVLYTYDSILIDYSKEDGIQFVKDVKDLLESTGYMTKMKRGVSYDFE